MVPMLNEKAREAVSYLMYGFYLGEKLSDTKEPFRVRACINSIRGVTGKYNKWLLQINEKSV